MGHRCNHPVGEDKADAHKQRGYESQHPTHGMVLHLSSPAGLAGMKAQGSVEYSYVQRRGGAHASTSGAPLANHAPTKESQLIPPTQQLLGSTLTAASWWGIGTSTQRKFFRYANPVCSERKRQSSQTDTGRTQSWTLTDLILQEAALRAVTQ